MGPSESQWPRFVKALLQYVHTQFYMTNCKKSKNYICPMLYYKKYIETIVGLSFSFFSKSTDTKKMIQTEK